RILPLDPLLPAVAHRVHPRTQRRERRQPAAENQEPRDHRQKGDHQERVQVDGEPGTGMKAHPEDEREVTHAEQPGGPEERAEEQSRAECPEERHASPIRYPSPRTVSITSLPSLRRSLPMKTSTVFESRSE